MHGALSPRQEETTDNDVELYSLVLTRYESCERADVSITAVSEQ